MFPMYISPCRDYMHLSDSTLYGQINLNVHAAKPCMKEGMLEVTLARASPNGTSLKQPPY